MNTTQIYNRNKGFSLLEVLIAIVILSIGLLGIAAMQVVSMKNNHSAYLRSQASLLAYEFSDIIRSNPIAMAADKFGDAAADGVDLNTANLGFTISSACLGYQNECDPTPPNDTPDKLAEVDLANWALKINQTLPSGMATISRSGDIYNITVSWLDDRTDSDGQGVNVNGDVSGSTNDDIDLTADLDGDGDNDISVAGNEANFKQIIVSLEP